jgi:hypothetical protein
MKSSADPSFDRSAKGANHTLGRASLLNVLLVFASGWHQLRDVTE